MSYFYRPKKRETRPPLGSALPARSRTLASLYVSGIVPLLPQLPRRLSRHGKPSGFGGAEVFLAERSGVSWSAHSCSEPRDSVSFYGSAPGSVPGESRVAQRVPARALGEAGVALTLAVPLLLNTAFHLQSAV